MVRGWAVGPRFKGVVVRLRAGVYEMDIVLSLN